MWSLSLVPNGEFSRRSSVNRDFAIHVTAMPLPICSLAEPHFSVVRSADERMYTPQGQRKSQCGPNSQIIRFLSSVRKTLINKIGGKLIELPAGNPFWQSVSYFAAFAFTWL